MQNEKNKMPLLGHADSLISTKANRYGFTVGDLGFLMVESTLSEIVINPKIYPIPKTKEWVKGMINIRGNLMPVFDFSMLLGIGVAKQQPGSKNIFILGKDNQSIGLLIDELPQEYNVSNWQKIAQFSTQFSGQVVTFEKYIICAYLLKGNVWIDFNYNEYFKSIKNSIINVSPHNA